MFPVELRGRRAKTLMWPPEIEQTALQQLRISLRCNGFTGFG